MSDSLAGRAIFTVIKVSFLVISSILFAIGYLLNMDTLAYQDWQETQAKVLHSQITKSTEKLYGRDVIVYNLDVTYKYKADGKVYKTKGLFGATGVNKTLPLEYYQEMYKTYKPNANVKAYYKPDDSTKSYLVINPKDGLMTLYETSKKMFIVSLILFIIGPILYLIKNGPWKKEEKIKLFEVPKDAKRIRRH